MSDVFDLLVRPDWMEHAACRGIDPNLFFPTRPEGAGTGGEVEAAKKVCAGCPVREECLEYALDNGEKFGIFGGKSERERRRLRRGRGRRVAS